MINMVSPMSHKARFIIIVFLDSLTVRDCLLITNSNIEFDLFLYGYFKQKNGRIAWPE